MRNSLGMAALAAAALVSGEAGATPLVVGDSGLVIDVEFWGRQRLRNFNPEDPTDDIITYGDPVQGTFRIFADDAPAPGWTTAFLDAPNAVAYGRATPPVRDPPPASLVTSRWLSALPAPFVNDVSPFPGDHVQIADGVLFRPEGPVQDWFEVLDRSSDDVNRTAVDTLFITVTTPRDIIQGVGLDQEFDLVNPAENGGTSGGFFAGTVDGLERFIEFIVDRVRVSPRVCKP